MSEQVTSKDQLAELKKYHAEIVESDGAECEAMRLTRWAIEQIERLRRENDALAKLSSQWITEAQREKDARYSTSHEAPAQSSNELVAYAIDLVDGPNSGVIGRMKRDAEGNYYLRADVDAVIERLRERVKDLQQFHDWAEPQITDLSRAAPEPTQTVPEDPSCLSRAMFLRRYMLRQGIEFARTEDEKQLFDIVLFLEKLAAHEPEVIDDLYALLVRRGYAQHEAHEIAKMTARIEAGQPTLPPRVVLPGSIYRVEPPPPSSSLDSEVGAVLIGCGYLDRMNDLDESDTAEDVVRDFVEAVRPVLTARYSRPSLTKFEWCSDCPTPLTCCEKRACDSGRTSQGEGV